MERNKKSKTQTNVPESSNTREFKTNIPLLDRLLGYNESLNCGTGIGPGDIIVIRGGPGSGKTTLGLQIMSSYLASDDCRYIEQENNPAAFISLELEAEKAVEKVKKDYGFFKEREKLLEQVSSDYIVDSIRWLMLKLRLWKIGLVPGTIITYIVWYFWHSKGLQVVVPGVLSVVGLLYEIFRLPFNIPFRKRPALKDKLSKCVRESISSSIRARKKGKKKAKPEINGRIKGIIFIDSINVLLTMVRQCAGLNDQQSRLVFNSVLNLLREDFSQYVIIISSEFHHEETWVCRGRCRCSMAWAGSEGFWRLSREDCSRWRPSGPG